MRHFTRTSVFFFLLLASHLLVAQGYNAEQGGASVPSATALSYGKYADIPVNQYTGTGNVSVPLHTVSDGPLSLPVFLQYHTGGLPVNSPASAVGLGWNLNTGGMISRTVMGLPDDMPEGYYHKGYTVEMTASKRQDAANGIIDSEPDIFTYSVGSYYGKFLLDATGAVRMMPETDLKISVNLTNNKFVRFIITAPDGTKFYFGKSKDNNRTAYDYMAIDSGADEDTDRNGWHLLDIVSADEKHAIELDYLMVGYQYDSPSYCPDVVKYLKNNGNVVTVSNCSGDSYQTNHVLSVIPTSISTPYETITFSNASRIDQLPYFFTHGHTSNIPKKRVTGLSVQNGGFCTKYDFTQNYFKQTNSTADNKRLKLQAIQRKSCDNSVSEPAWTFDYHGADNGDGTTFFPVVESRDIDHWGYFNYNSAVGSNYGLPDLTPASSIYVGQTLISHGSANRKSNEAAMKNGMLTRVTYPTGGSLAMDYEANRHYNPGGSTNALYEQSCYTSNCGGIETETSDPLLITADIYNTGTWELCLTVVDDDPNNGYDPNDNYARVEVLNASNQVIQSREFNSTTNTCQNGTFPYLTLGTAIQQGQYYRFRVKSKNGLATFSVNYDGGGTNAICGGLRLKKTTISDGSGSTTRDIIKTYNYESASVPGRSSGKLYREPKYVHGLPNSTVIFSEGSYAPLADFGGYHLGYERVTVDLNGLGYQEFVYELEEDGTDVNGTFPIGPVKYKAEAGTLVQSKSYNAADALVASSSTSRYTGDNYENIGCISDGSNNCIGADGEMFRVRKTYIYSGTSAPEAIVTYPATPYQHRTSVYRPRSVTAMVDGLTTTTQYEYHPNNLLPSAVETTNSDGDEYRTVTNYTVDYGSTNLRNRFVSLNMTNLPYRVRKYHNGSHVDGSETTYRFWNTSGTSPSNSPHSGYSMPRPYYDRRYTRTYDTNGNLQSGSYQIQMYYRKYNSHGLLKEYQEPGWNKVYLGYSGKLPVSKSFNGYVTSYQYHGSSTLLSTITAVDGTSTSYDYDDLLRLETVTDDCRNVITTNDYHFTTGGSDKNYTSVTTNYPAPSSHSQLVVTQIKTYLDGLGRQLQTVAVGMGPNTGEDIVSGVDYDKYGRVIKSYEPRAYAGGGGNFQTPTGSWKFSTTSYENSPLSRQLTVTSAETWLGTDYTYGTNTSDDDVMIDAGDTEYLPGRLTKRTIIDGNNNRLIVFTDKLGRKILSRRTNQNDDSSARLDTYYRYDGKGRSTMVLPPGATTATPELIYTYRYDGEDKLLEKKIPGRDPIEYRYNTRDLLAAERDGYLTDKGKWYAYNYDIFGREVSSGFYATTPPTTISNLIPTEELLKTTYGTSGIEKGRVKTIENKILDGGNNWLTTTNSYTTCGLLNFQTGNNHIFVSPTTPEMTTYAYDGADNLTGSVYTHRVTNGTPTTIASEHHIDHAGRSKMNKFRINGGTNQRLNHFTYDAKGQLITKKQGGYGSTAYMQKIDYGYLENGMLKGINLNGLNDNSPTSLPVHNGSASLPSASLQTVGSDAADLFFLQLYRHTTPATTGIGNAPARFNGDITYASSQVRGRTRQIFGLKYDTYDRMTEAKFYEQDSYSSLADPYEGYYEKATYDARGNIQSLDRKNLTPSGSNWRHTLIDDLTYYYPTNSNQFNQLYDSGQSQGYNNSYYEQFEYDTDDNDPGNGNITYDPSRQVDITYNHLDLPVEIDWRYNNQKLVMTYDAAGTLLSRKQYNGATLLKTRDYVGGIEYENGQLAVVHHQEGQVKFTGSSQEWQYNLTDHLGNTRVVYADKHIADGKINVATEIVQEAHYLPFGMKMEGPWLGGGAGAGTAYQYNGIEYVEDFDLDVNMAIYRTLDPVIGRWWSVDPDAEQFHRHTPYNSMMNSPMVLNDPNGDNPILIGAAIGVIGNGIGNAIAGRNFFEGAGRAALFGAIGGGISSGIGGIASNLAKNGASSFGVAAFQAGAHGLSGGALSAAQGGNFWHGAAAGAFSSAVGSGVGELGGGGGLQILGGALSGGFGSAIAGGNFLEGAIQGTITSGLNHAAHSLYGPGDPPKLIDRTAGPGGSMWLHYDDGSTVFLPSQGTLERTPAPWEYAMGAGLLKTGTSAATTTTASTSYKLVRAGFQAPRWWRKNIFSYAKTADGGRVITLFNKIQYVGYRVSSSGTKHGYHRSIKINRNNKWKHWKDW